MERARGGDGDTRRARGAASARPDSSPSRLWRLERRHPAVVGACTYTRWTRRSSSPGPFPPSRRRVASASRRAGRRRAEGGRALGSVYRDGRHERGRDVADDDESACRSTAVPDARAGAPRAPHVTLDGRRVDGSDGRKDTRASTPGPRRDGHGVAPSTNPPSAATVARLGNRRWYSAVAHPRRPGARARGAASPRVATSSSRRRSRCGVDSGSARTARNHTPTAEERDSAPWRRHPRTRTRPPSPTDSTATVAPRRGGATAFPKDAPDAGSSSAQI